jgi:hypothetical protein
MSRIENVSWYTLLFCLFSLGGAIVLAAGIPELAAVFTFPAAPIMAVYSPELFTALALLLAAVYCILLAGSVLFGALGFPDFAPVVFLNRKRLDERDRAILRKAQTSGHLVFWGVFVSGILSAWAWQTARDIETIPVDCLPLAVFAGGWIVITVQFIATIILYRRGVVLHGE